LQVGRGRNSSCAFVHLSNVRRLLDLAPRRGERHSLASCVDLELGDESLIEQPPPL
jgi:hypothetical protein